MSPDPNAFRQLQTISEEVNLGVQARELLVKAGTIKTTPADLSSEQFAAKLQDEISRAWAWRFARDFATKFRRVAELGFLIHSATKEKRGSLVDVTSGKHCPYGRYEVVRHYHRSDRAAVYVELRDPNKRKSPVLDCPVECVEVVPDYAWAFQGSEFSQFWLDVLPGIAANLSPTAWLMAADRLEEWDGTPTEYGPADTAEVPRWAFLEALRGEQRANGWYGGLAGYPEYTAPIVQTLDVIRCNKLRPHDYGDLIPLLKGRQV